MQKIWNIQNYDPIDVDNIQKRYHISEVLAKLLIARKIDMEEMDTFLNGNMEDIADPYLIKDMDRMVERIQLALTRKEKICIYGDYDVDGITSITIMYQFLTKLGADVMYYLPDRLIEGYGINCRALSEIKEKGCLLIITVDCGITAVEETKYAKEIGLDMCITDHHECAEQLPQAISIVNPKQKEDTSTFKMHAGVGVAFKCLMAIAKAYHLEEESYLQYLDIVAIGTISDIVPLIGENRIISKFGLEQMKKTKNIGLRALLDIVSFKDMDSTMVSFGLAPRINACGRMGKAGIAVSLLLEQDERNAKELANMLDSLNIKRQQVEKEIYEQAIVMIEQNHLEEQAGIVLYEENWHNGVIGIVASRLVNIYYKPVILLTKEQGIIRGSGRCPNGISLYRALTDCKDTLIQFGGHELAAGLSIQEDKIQEFQMKFNAAIYEQCPDGRDQIIDIDTQITIKDLSINLIKDIYCLRPYGQANKLPQFVYKGLKITAIRTLKEDKHLKLTLKDNKFLVEALAFSQGGRRDELRIGDKIDVVCHVEINTFTTPKTIQLIVQDFKKAVEN